MFDRAVTAAKSNKEFLFCKEEMNAVPLIRGEDLNKTGDAFFDMIR